MGGGRYWLLRVSVRIWALIVLLLPKSRRRGRREKGRGWGAGFRVRRRALLMGVHRVRATNEVEGSGGRVDVCREGWGSEGIQSGWEMYRGDKIVRNVDTSTCLLCHTRSPTDLANAIPSRRLHRFVIEPLPGQRYHEEEQSSAITLSARPTRASILNRGEQVLFRLH